MLLHLPGGQDWEIKEGRGNANVKCRLDTNTSHPTRRDCGELKLPLCSLKKLSVSLSKSQEGVWSSSEVWMGSQALISVWSLIIPAAGGGCAWCEFLITWSYQHHTLWNIFHVKMHIHGYQWKGRNLTSNNLGHGYRHSFTSQWGTK